MVGVWNVGPKLIFIAPSLAKNVLGLEFLKFYFGHPQDPSAYFFRVLSEEWRRAVSRGGA